MSETNPPRRVGRSIVAVLVGMVVGIVATIGTDIVLRQIGVFPPWGASMVGYDGALGLATLYRAIYGIAASYIIARLAPDRPMQHALVGGFLGLVVALWCRGYLEQRTGFRASLVSPCAHRASDAAGLGGRPTLRRAVEGTSPA